MGGRIEYYFELFEERAAIIEFDANMGEGVAKSRAFYQIVDQYCQDNEYKKDSREAELFKKELRDHMKKVSL